MPSIEKKELLEKLKGKLSSRLGFKNPQEKKKALSRKSHFNRWYPLYRYGKERSQFNNLRR
ncbi:MAG: hypothetical protein P1P89_09115 [Desulfobacterales bacterium]|nr:hypothetical protein [Desulfobacterales bacterium]